MSTETSVEMLKNDIAPVVQDAAAITIITPEQYQGAADWLKAVKSAQKRVTDFFKPIKDKAYEAHKAITSKEAETLKPLKDAENLVKGKMIGWSAEQERIRAAEQARLQAESDARAEAERKRLEKEAAKLKTPELREARLAEAAAVVAPVVQVAAKVPEVKGQSLRKTWKAKIVNVSILPREWMTPNQQALDAFARSTKGAVAVAGVEWYEEIGMSSTSK